MAKETGRDDFIISIRSAFLNKGTRQKFSLFTLLIVSIIILSLEYFQTGPIDKFRSITKDIIFKGSYVVSSPFIFIEDKYYSFQAHMSMYEEYENLKKELEGFRSIGRELGEKNKRLAGLESQIQSLDSNIERTQKEIEKLQEKKELDSVEESTLQSLQEDLRTLEGQYQGLCETKQTYEYANELLRDSGIKTKIIRQYVPIINKYVNKYLNELDFLINFTIDENFSETIRSQYRDEFSYASFSEGEKMRIDLALLFTWRMVAKLKNSVNTNLLILDEVFDSSLDTEGTDAFLKIINTLDADTNVFVISHKGEILFDKFLSTIKFVKEKSFSRIEAG